MNLKEFSQRLGLSISTVSRALNGYADVSESTRERIVRAAAEWGYTPNSAGRRLRLNTIETVGFILTPPQTHFASPFFQHALEGIEEALKERGKTLVVTSARDRATEIETFRKMVESQYVDALIFGRTRRDDERIRYLLDANVPFVTIGRSNGTRPFPFVDIDHFHSGRAATKRLIEMGHRRIGLLNSPHELMYSWLCLEGYQHAHQEAGLPIDPALMLDDEPTEDAGKKGMGRLFDLDDPPTAVVCAYDLVAFGVYGALRERGLRPGRDISVIGCDDIPGAEHLDPPLTTFRAETALAGRRAVEFLFRRIDGEPVETLQEVWDLRLVPRQSDHPLNST